MQPRRILHLVIVLLSVLSTSRAVLAEDFKFAPDFEVGSQFPKTVLLNQQGEETEVGASITGRGQLIAFNRSVVW